MCVCRVTAFLRPSRRTRAWVSNNSLDLLCDARCGAPGKGAVVHRGAYARAPAGDLTSPQQSSIPLTGLHQLPPALNNPRHPSTAISGCHRPSTPHARLVQALVQKWQDALRGVDDVHELVVRATGPELPSLDLVDMPGLVLAPGRGEPGDLPCQTRAVLRAQVEAQGAHTLCLAAVKATQAPNSSSAMAFVHEHALQRCTCGVFTFCDELTEKPKDRLVQWVTAPVQPTATAPEVRAPAFAPALGCWGPCASHVPPPAQCSCPCPRPPQGRQGTMAGGSRWEVLLAAGSHAGAAAGRSCREGYAAVGSAFVFSADALAFSS